MSQIISLLARKKPPAWVQQNQKNTGESVLTIASAGGHLTQALCMMSAIERFHLVTSVDLQLDVGAQSYHLIRDTQFNPFIHLRNLLSAFMILRKVKPSAVFSTGGPICLPFAVVAKIFGVKFIYLDTLSRVEDLSNTARFLYKHDLATEMYAQWQSVAARYPGIEYKGKTFDIGRESLAPQDVCIKTGDSHESS